MNIIVSTVISLGLVASPGYVYSNKMSKWGEETTMKFVSEYHKHECLWKFDSEAYKNRNCREQAYVDIVNAMGLPDFVVYDVKKKIKNLRSTYYQELRKVRESQSSGCPKDEVYESKLKWFKKMTYIINCDTSAKPSNVNNSHDVTRISSDDDQTKDDTADNLNFSHSIWLPFSDDQSKKNPTTPAEKKMKTRTRSHSSDAPLIPPEAAEYSESKSYRSKKRLATMQSVNMALNKLQELSSQPEQEVNEFATFGKYVSLQLKQLPLPIALRAKQRILSYLTDLRLSSLNPPLPSQNHVSSNGCPISSHQTLNDHHNQSLDIKFDIH